MTVREIPEIIQKLSENGISILDMQKIDYHKLEYDSGNFSRFNKSHCYFSVRGSNFNIHIGYVLKISRENLKF